MADELITEGNLSKEMLQALFKAAYMDVSLDSDGDIVVKETYRCWAFPDEKGRWIRLMSLFGVKPNASLPDKLDYCNRVNDELVVIRAYVNQRGGIGFDYYIPVQGGISRQNVIQSVKRFHLALGGAIEKDTKDVLS